MTRKERLLQDIQYTVDYKIDKFYIKREIKGFEGLITELYVLSDLIKLKDLITKSENDNLTYKEQRIVSWGNFSVHENKYVKNVVLGDKLGEDIYD